MIAAYGLAVTCAEELSALEEAGGGAVRVTGHPLRMEAAAAAAVGERFSGPPERHERATARIEGRPWVVERGTGGDLLATWGDRLHVHLDPAVSEMTCAADPSDPAVARVLLDAGLTTACLAAGYEAMHAGAVERDGRAVAIAGPRGAGKSTLVGQLLADGMRLVADDVLALQSVDGVVRAHPAPRVMTVPREASRPASRRLGVTPDGEDWVRTEDVAAGPLPLAAVVILQRGPGPRAAELVTAGSPLGPLLGLMLDSGSAPAREAARFAIVGDLAARAEILVLRAPETTPAAQLAAMIQSRLA